MTLKSDLQNQTPIWYENRPPLASDITAENIKKLVPPCLFNFMTWLLGFSDDPEDAQYITAIAQATINTSNILSREFVAAECVNLVYDKIDFVEKIDKQTHVTNGIITQPFHCSQMATLAGASITSKCNDMAIHSSVVPTIIVNAVLLDLSILLE